MVVFNKQYFINKFKAIPDSLWNIGWWHGPNGSHCALGHCGQSFDDAPEEAKALVKLFGDFESRRLVPDINDDRHPKYKQSTPKARVLAALEDLPDGQG